MILVEKRYAFFSGVLANSFGRDVQHIWIPSFATPQREDLEIIVLATEKEKIEKVANLALENAQHCVLVVAESLSAMQAFRNKIRATKSDAKYIFYTGDEAFTEYFNLV